MDVTSWLLFQVHHGCACRFRGSCMSISNESMERIVLCRLRCSHLLNMHHEKIGCVFSSQSCEVSSWLGSEMVEFISEFHLSLRLLGVLLTLTVSPLWWHHHQRKQKAVRISERYQRWRSNAVVAALTISLLRYSDKSCVTDEGKMCFWRMVFLTWPKQQRHHEDHYSQSIVSRISHSMLRVCEMIQRIP